MGYYSNVARGFFGGPATRAVKFLIWVNIAVFVLQMIADLAGVRFLVFTFALIPRRVTHEFTVWQFFTYMFLHGGVFHILFNMITLYMFGNELERYWGTLRFSRYYLITGIGAGLCSWVAALDSRAAIIGASGAIYGVLLAYGLLFPNRIVYLNFLLPIKVKWLVLIMGVVAFFSSLSGGQPGVAHVAHLGGMLVGLLMLRGKRWIVRLAEYRERRRREMLKRQFEVYYGDIRRKIDEEKKGPTVH
ncbi:MAG: rhomboid family intramembrane serine protease [Acidobacteria bacterium]|nr:rhomboid family intramembrane serine protease [Acidobacteriota bacterium]